MVNEILALWHRQVSMMRWTRAAAAASLRFYALASANSSSSLCSDRSKYVFWDAFHPTEAANLIVAGKLLDGDAVAAWPINVRELSEYGHK